MLKIKNQRNLLKLSSFKMKRDKIVSLRAQNNSEKGLQKFFLFFFLDLLLMH